MTDPDEPQLSTEATREAALRWKAAWERNWAAGTLHDVLPLYDPDVVFCTFAHREPDMGPEAIGRVFDTFQSVSSDVKCVFGEPLVAGNRAVLEWWSSWTEDGERMSMAGVSTLWFGADGLVVQSRDYWNICEGETSPYEGW